MRERREVAKTPLGFYTIILLTTGCPRRRPEMPRRNHEHLRLHGPPGRVAHDAALQRLRLEDADLGVGGARRHVPVESAKLPFFADASAQLLA